MHYITIGECLFSGRLPFGQYLHDFSSVLPDHVLKWLSQRQRLKTTLKPISPTPGAENILMPKTEPVEKEVSGGGGGENHIPLTSRYEAYHKIV